MRASTTLEQFHFGKALAHDEKERTETDDDEEPRRDVEVAGFRTGDRAQQEARGHHRELEDGQFLATENVEKLNAGVDREDHHQTRDLVEKEHRGQEAGGQ